MWIIIVIILFGIIFWVKKSKKIIFQELVSIKSVKENYIVIETNWKGKPTQQLIMLKDVENSGIANDPETSAIYTVYKKQTFLGTKIVKELTLVEPLKLSSKKIDKILNKVKKEDPWKF